MKNVCYSPIKYMGSKNKLAKKIIPYFPEHICFVDVFGGSGTVLFQKKESFNEVYNDICSDLVGFFRVIRVKSKKEKLINLFCLTPKSREEFNTIRNNGHVAREVEKAYRWFYVNFYSFNGDGGFSTGPSKPGVSKDECVRRINLYSKRFKDVIIESLDWREVIERYDRPTTLFYLDPPYVNNKITRTKNNHYYNCDFSLKDHIELLKRIREVEGRVILSGYSNRVYNNLLEDWSRLDFDVDKASSPITMKDRFKPENRRATESIWISPTNRALKRRNRNWTSALLDFYTNRAMKRRRRSRSRRVVVEASN